MKRLTIKGFKFTSDYIVSNLQNQSMADALNKLSEYEDIELTPNEITQALKRLAQFEDDVINEWAEVVK